MQAYIELPRGRSVAHKAGFTTRASLHVTPAALSRSPSWTCVATFAAVARPEPQILILGETRRLDLVIQTAYNSYVIARFSHEQGSDRLLIIFMMEKGDAVRRPNTAKNQLSGKKFGIDDSSRGNRTAVNVREALQRHEVQ